MTNGTAVAEPAKKAEGMTDEQKKAIVAEKTAKLAALFAKGDTGSPEALGLMAEIAKLGKAKAPRAESDPAKVAEKDGLTKWLADNKAELEGQLNEAASEMFPILAKGGMKLEVVIRPKGVGRSGKTGESGSRANMAPRIVHRLPTGERFIKEAENLTSYRDEKKVLRIPQEQGLPSVKHLCAAYPDDAEKITAALGSAEGRKAKWNESGKDKTKKYVTLSDGTFLTMQS